LETPVEANTEEREKMAREKAREKDNQKSIKSMREKRGSKKT